MVQPREGPWALCGVAGQCPDRSALRAERALGVGADARAPARTRRRGDRAGIAFARHRGASLGALPRATGDGAPGLVRDVPLAERAPRVRGTRHAGGDGRLPGRSPDPRARALPDPLRPAFQDRGQPARAARLLSPTSTATTCRSGSPIRRTASFAPPRRATKRNGTATGCPSPACSPPGGVANTRVSTSRPEPRRPIGARGPCSSFASTSASTGTPWPSSGSRVPTRCSTAWPR